MEHDIQNVTSIETQEIIPLIKNDGVDCVVDVKNIELCLCANMSEFKHAQDAVLVSADERDYIEGLGPEYLEEKRKLADEINALEQKKAIQTKLLEQFKTRAAAWLEKCDPELANLLNNDIEKRCALINNLEQRIEENKRCIAFVQEREDKLAQLPVISTTARNLVNTELVVFERPKKRTGDLSTNISTNLQAFFAFNKSKTAATAENKLTTPSNHNIPTMA